MNQHRSFGQRLTRRGTPRRGTRVAVRLAAIAALALILAACDTTPRVLNGTVTTTNGTLAGAVPVALYADDSETLVAQTTTNALGTYSFHQSTVPDGTYRLRVADQWHPDATTWADAEPLDLTAATPTTIDFTLTANASSSGTIVHPDLTPAAGALVFARNTAGTIIAHTYTAADGTFTLELTDPTTHTIHLAQPPGTTTIAIGGPTPTVFTPDLGEDLTVGTIDLTTGLPITDPGPGPSQRIAAGNLHTCAVRGTGAVACWGYNEHGQLGNGTTSIINSIPVPVTGITDATAITAGTNHTCALHATGTISCWGHNDEGQFGNGTTTDSTTPVPVAGITDATAITAGPFHTCALHSTGTISCWGYNHQGRLGNGTTTNSTTPAAVTGITDATVVTAAGNGHTCAVHATGTVSCWGSNYYGQLGNGTTTNSSTPTPVTGITDATDVSATGNTTCTLRSTGAASCWGWNVYGQVGNGNYADALSPVHVAGLTAVTAVTAGNGHTCAVHGAGTVSCWGYNGNGQLGHSTANTTVPVAVTGITDATTLALSGAHTCALHGTGAISCWGNNSRGQLGNGTSGPVAHPTPVPVVGFP